VADGRYEVRINGQEVVDSNGQKYLLDLRNIEGPDVDYTNTFPSVWVR